MLVLENSTDYFAKSEAGGKGYNLYLLTRRGIPVPAWITLGKSAFERFLAESGAGAALAAELRAFEAGALDAKTLAERAAALFRAATLPPAVADAVADAYRRLGEGAVSVRSSAVGEDGAAHSFAGQLSSFLYVTGLADVQRCVVDCWASAYSERSIAYRRQNGIPLGGAAAVAVVVQRMVDPDVSGVMFTCDPTANSLDRYVVSAVYGVGEGLVSGLLEADTYWLDASTGAPLRRDVADKQQMLRAGGSGRCESVPVPAALQGVAALSDEQLRELAALGKAVHAFYRQPQDIEWAIAGGRIVVLQARPVTALGTSLTGYANLWDNSNIVESYGGITLPLSFTFALENYKAVYVLFCETLGVPRAVVKDMEAYLGNMLGTVNGRVFYNLYNWYKLVGILPGYESNSSFMETMMGVGQALPPEIRDRIAPHRSWNTLLGKLRKARTGLTFAYYHFAIQGTVDAYLRDFDEHYQVVRRKDYDRMSGDELYLAHVDLMKSFLGKWQAPIINDFLCMFHFGLLKRLTATWLADLEPSLQNDLLSGEGGLESAEPTRTLIRYAGEVERDPALRALIESTSDYDCLEALNQSEFRGFYERVLDYIDRFGYRCISEMKMEEKDLLADPSFLFTVLKNYLRSGTTDLAAYERREKALRVQAEAKLAGALRGWKKLAYRWSLTHARKAVKNRENTRFARTRLYGVSRMIFRELGARLSQQGITAAPEDIYYLTQQEVYGIYQGTVPGQDLKALVDVRKTAYAAFEQAEPKIRFETRGAVYWNNAILDVPVAQDVPAGADYDLAGIACCPGIVEGRVRVIHSAQDDLRLDGEILVAKRTDPGWVPIFPSISGLLVERGSLLSHSAIVAREMGIPAVVGIKGLLNTIRDGMYVRMDGKAGTIKILAAPEPPAAEAPIPLAAP